MQALLLYAIGCLLLIALVPTLRREAIEACWEVVAWVVSRPRVFAWLKTRAMRTPYSPIGDYMDRYWLFNAFDKVMGNEVTPIRWLPSIRLHHIRRRDEAQHHHDHPWDARTIVLDGMYQEARVVDYNDMGEIVETNHRFCGDTARVEFGCYHTITWVPEGGVWTMFITFGYKGTWGFLVDGKKVPWFEYLATHPDKKDWSESDLKNVP